jgi:hypothetical protein
MLLYRAVPFLELHTPVNVRCSQAQFPSALLEDDATRESFLELFGHLGGVIRTRIVNDHNFEVELAVNC